MTKILTQIKNFWQKFTSYNRFIFFATLGYLVLISAFMVWHHVFFSPDRIFFALLGLMIVVGRGWTFFLDWTPSLLLILGYDYMRGLVPIVVTKVHIRAMIYFDRLVFHVVPTVALQQALFKPSMLHWYDYVAACLYLSHFIVPFVVAFVFWYSDRAYFKRYMAAMVVLSYLAFFTYLVFPAMPPWMAATQGFLPPVTHITDLAFAHFAPSLTLPTVYNYFGANLVAAVPSLHAAYPLMAALFFVKKFPRYGKLFFLYPLAMWFSVIYLGEHYVFDVLVAIFYVMSVYLLIMNWTKIKGKFFQKKEEYNSLPLTNNN